MSAVGRSIYFCCVVFVVVGAGCEGNDKKKSALNEQEIERLTYAQKPVRADQLIVSGEVLTYENVMASLPDEAANGASFHDKLVEAAKQTRRDEFLEIARPVMQQRVGRRISSIVLSQRARRELGKNIDEERLERSAESALRTFILEAHGGNAAKADEALERAMMNRSMYREWVKRQVLIRYLINSKVPRDMPVSYREMQARYEQVKEERYVVPGETVCRLIDIEVAKVKLEDPNENPLAKARQLAESLRKRIDAGEDFVELARQYSHEPRGQQGGLWKPRDPALLTAPYDMLSRKAREMTPGEVADPIETPGHLLLMKLETRQDKGYRPLDDVQDEIREDIRGERRRRALVDLDAEVSRQVTLVDADPFVDYCLGVLYQRAHAPQFSP